MNVLCTYYPYINVPVEFLKIKSTGTYYWWIVRVHENENPPKIHQKESIEVIKFVEFDEFSWSIFKRKFVLFRGILPERSCNPCKKNPRKSMCVLSIGFSWKLFPQKPYLDSQSEWTAFNGKL